MRVTNRSSEWPEGSSDARALFGTPMEVTASYIRAAMIRPSSGGLNQRERTNSESFWRTSRSAIERNLPVFEAAQMNGVRNHLLQVPARASGDSSTETSALSSQRSAQCVHRQVVTERTRQHGAVDAARRCPRDDVDDHAQFDTAPDLAQQLEIDLLGVVFRIVAVDVIEERGAGAASPVGDRVQRARGADQLEDFLADAMHVDGERNAAEADQRNAKFFLAQSSTPQPG